MEYGAHMDGLVLDNKTDMLSIITNEKTEDRNTDAGTACMKWFNYYDGCNFLINVRNKVFS